MGELCPLPPQIVSSSMVHSSPKFQMVYKYLFFDHQISQIFSEQFKQVPPSLA